MSGSNPTPCDRCHGTGVVNGIGEFNGMPEFRSWPCERCRRDPDFTRKMLEGDFKDVPLPTPAQTASGVEL